MAKRQFRKCACKYCMHPDTLIDTDDSGSYVHDKKKKCYYHSDCYDQMINLNNDIALFNDLWTKHISNTVNYGYLRKIINEYLDRGIKMEYILFCLQYVIANRMTLNYPGGFKYYIDRREIKEAYEKQETQRKFEAIKKEQKELKEKSPEQLPIGSTNAPSFAIKKQKEEGFGSILK